MAIYRIGGKRDTANTFALILDDTGATWGDYRDPDDNSWDALVKSPQNSDSAFWSQALLHPT